MHNAPVIILHVVIVDFGMRESIKVVGQGFRDVLTDNFHIGVPVRSGLFVLKPDSVAQFVDNYSFLR